MTRPITSEEQRDIDWDWYAVDAQGHIGHFTSAGQTSLPASVAEDFQAAQSLISFFEHLTPSTTFIVLGGVEEKCGVWKDAKARERYLESFGQAARRGLFSYDIGVTEGQYFCVASPDTPIHIDHMPTEIRELLNRTKASAEFYYTWDIPASETFDW